MNWILYWTLAPLLLFTPKTASVTSNEPIIETNNTSFCITAQEKALIDEINTYRKSKGLHKIAISPSMTIVAREHARQLNDEIKDLTHSWVGCNYDDTKNPRAYDCMWKQPQRLTNYPGNGYECAFGKWGSPFTVKEVLNGWKRSPAHNDMIVNKKIWKKANWKAIGVGMKGNYAVLWLGKKTDPKGVVSQICKESPNTVPSAVKTSPRKKVIKRKIIRKRRTRVKRN